MEEQTLVNVWVDMLGIDQVTHLCCVLIACLHHTVCFDFDLMMQTLDDVVRRFRQALCAARVIVVCLTPTYLTRPNCLRELRWALDFAASGVKRVVLLPMHPAVTYDGVLKMMQPGHQRGLLYSSKTKSAMRIKAAALELLSHVKFKSQMTQLSCHELQVRARAAERCAFRMRMLTRGACAGVEER